jgi:SAM-dependent methyltransferase
MRRRIKEYFEPLYELMKRDFLGEKTKIIPQKYWSQFICLGGASEVQYQIGQLIPNEKKRVLVVGIFGGRDYFYLKTIGKDCFALDLYPDDDFENLTISNVESNIPYPDKYFDVVVIGEVLEHLVHDYNALQNIRRVLKDNGLLILSIPFLNDYEPTHIRLFNRKIAEKLLKVSGFIVDKIFERPNLFLYPSLINLLHHGVNALFFIFFKRGLYKVTLPLFWRLEVYLAKKSNPFRRYFKNYGAIFKCRKGERFDYIDFNRQRFGER